MPDYSLAQPPSVPPLGTRPAGAPPLDQPYYRAPFGAAFKRFWQKYAIFTGRASRAEFWWWALTYFGINVLASIVMASAGALAGGGAPLVIVVCQTVWTAATILPFAALTWRRLHDSNHHGWWALPFLVLAGLQSALNAFGVQSVVSTATSGGDPAAITVSVTTGILGLAFGVLILVLTLRPPNAAGHRFDK